MLDALKKLFTGGDLPNESTVAIGLLLEVIRMDDDFDAAERAAVSRLVARRFGGTENEAAKLIEDAAETSRTTYDDNQLLKSINAGYSLEQKTALIEMLWEIALADGELHRFENHAILAIANQLGMGQAELDATKATAKARLAA
ncbi:MAG: TerB family tellurite resistance protein [Candidatus Phaeomarinobacter sp.]